MKLNENKSPIDMVGRYCQLLCWFIVSSSTRKTSLVFNCVNKSWGLASRRVGRLWRSRNGTIGTGPANVVHWFGAVNVVGRWLAWWRRHAKSLSARLAGYVVDSRTLVGHSLTSRYADTRLFSFVLYFFSFLFRNRLTKITPKSRRQSDCVWHW